MHTMNKREMMVSVIGAFASTLLATFFSDTVLSAEGTHIILASTGATAILVFGMPHVPASQPWNIVGGHLVSAFVGVTCYILIPAEILAAAIAIPLAMFAMHSLRCMHPPGGATAITAVIGGGVRTPFVLRFYDRAGFFQCDNCFIDRDIIGDFS